MKAHHLLGTYKAPRFRYGSTTLCEVRGEVVFAGLTNARIPWPIGKRSGSRARALVVFGDLAKAVRRESASAVCYWWGVTAQTVSKWRKELGVPQMTEGTTRLRVSRAKESPAMAAALAKSWAKAGDPARRAKIAESRRGKRRLPHVIEAMRKGRLGKPHSKETRQKMSVAHKRRGTLPPKAGRPWTEKEEALLGKVPDELVARKTGRKVSAVVWRRWKLRIERWSPWD